MDDSKLVSNKPLNTFILPGVSLVLGIIADLLFYNQTLGINLFLLVVILQAVTLFFIWRKASKLRLDQMALAAFIVILAAMPAFRYDPFLNFINLMVIFGLLLIQLKSGVNPGLSNPFMARFVAVFVEIPVRLVQVLFTRFIPDNLKLFIHFKLSQKTTSGLVWVVVGVLISLPLLLIFSLLFASADPRFGQMFGDLFKFFSVLSFLQSTVAQAILVVIFTLIFGCGLSFLIYAQNSWLNQPASFPVRVISGYKTVINTIFVLINLLFGLFIGLQIGYMFGGQSNIKIDGFTYAEYARRGFGELLSISIISFILIKAGEYFVVRFSKNYPRDFQFLTGLWIFQVLLVAASALHRVILYEQAYGLTFIRLYSHIAIILIGLIFAAYLGKVIARATGNWFHQFLLGFLATSLVIINLINPSYLIGQDLTRNFKDTGKLDIEYLQTLEADALDFQLPALETRLTDSQITQKYNREGMDELLAGPKNQTPSFASREQGKLACDLLDKINQESKYGWPSFSWPRQNLINQKEKIESVIRERNYNCDNFANEWLD
jgi:Domain of unknown function (DUF4173)